MHTILVVGYSTRWRMIGWQNLADGTKTQPVTGNFWKSLINWFHFINLINLGIVFNLTLPALKNPPPINQPMIKHSQHWWLDIKVEFCDQSLFSSPRPAGFHGSIKHASCVRRGTHSSHIHGNPSVLSISKLPLWISHDYMCFGAKAIYHYREKAASSTCIVKPTLIHWHREND